MPFPALLFLFISLYDILMTVPPKRDTLWHFYAFIPTIELSRIPVFILNSFIKIHFQGI